MSQAIEPELARYLHRSPDQRRLLDAMATGHARGKHGGELGDPTPKAYRVQVRGHLERAPIGVALEDSGGRPRYLLADPAKNRVAWVTPHKEHRSTFFAPRQGAAAYVRAHLAATAPERRRALDLTPSARPPAAQRSAASPPATERPAAPLSPVYREGRERRVRRL